MRTYKKEVQSRVRKERTRIKETQRRNQRYNI